MHIPVENLTRHSCFYRSSNYRCYSSKLSSTHKLSGFSRYPTRFSYYSRCNLSTFLQKRTSTTHKTLSTSSRLSSSLATVSPFGDPIDTFIPLEGQHQLSSDYAPRLSRFDWRQRTISRVVQNDDKQHKQQSKKRIRRVRPQQATLGPEDLYYEALERYKERFLPLIEEEQQQEEMVLRERLGTWPLARLREEGYTLTGLSAYWLEQTQYGKPVACFQLGPGLSLPEHRFLNGTQVLLSRIDPLKEPGNRGAIVSGTPYQLNVTFPNRISLDPEDEHNTWRIDIGQSQYVFNQMREAIASFADDPQAIEEKSLYLPASALVTDIGSTDGDDGRISRTVAPSKQYILRGTHLRDVLLRSFQTSDHPHVHRPLQDPDDLAYVDSSVLDHGSRKTLEVPESESEIKEEGGRGEKKKKNTWGAFQDDMLIHSWARRYSSPNPVVVEGDPHLEGMNDSQRRAMAMMIRERISLVQGPPGTGKTRTIIETVKMLKAHFQVPHPILVCTYTNVAVDNLVEGLARAKLKPIRAASTGKSKTSLAQYTLGYQVENHPEQPTLKKLVQRKEAAERDKGELTKKLEALEQKELDESITEKEMKRKEKMTADLVKRERLLTLLERRVHAMEQDMVRDSLEKSDVICTTCITSASTALYHVDFPIVFLDEASMSTEPASLIPLMKGSQHVALIGDHKQLPPVITSPEAQAMGLGISLFERLTEEGEIPSIMLNIQYRMHPAISHFPSLEFYNLSLLDGTIDHGGYVSPKLMPPTISAALLPPGISGAVQEEGGGGGNVNDGNIRPEVSTSNRPPVIFLDHTGLEQRKAKSRVNWHEARIVASVVEDLLLHNDGLRGQDIGIIAPYVAQVSLLTRLFNTDLKYRERFRSVLGDHRAMQLANIEIKTVDGFEGREKEVIIFSTVRNNSGGYIGFLADRRRLNVGLTRAKRGLFVVGSLSTLKQSKMGAEGGGAAGAGTVQMGKGTGGGSWRRYVDYLQENGLVLSLAGKTLSKVLYGNLDAAAATRNRRVWT
ncbi:P-loop containing nucleoside triphosphate hydrolase protein [Dendrothele bispora CBS 962.96]|uniref:P-loop containing nucleoside triphosphate hydrolase protein n=1 Tax=Dendrothele bispora (strain CBS 962.96) TaxID=1314807 RepID=A0A4S8M7Q8_DENBC|nr:P-loop containing nucleoside triphosphate hydrolase protein [Dendrothele bispora CBS 962.96]